MASSSRASASIPPARTISSNPSYTSSTEPWGQVGARAEAVTRAAGRRFPAVVGKFEPLVREFRDLTEPREVSNTAFSYRVGANPGGDSGRWSHGARAAVDKTAAVADDDSSQRSMHEDSGRFAKAAEHLAASTCILASDLPPRTHFVDEDHTGTPDTWSGRLEHLFWSNRTERHNSCVRARSGQARR
jgi:hypothetical protein